MCPSTGSRERAIENHYFREDFRRAPFEEMGQVVYPPRAIETYTNSLLENWNTVAIRGRQPRLVLDYSSSAPAFFFSATLDKLGVETIALNTFSRVRSRFTLKESLPPAVARVGEMVRAMEADLGAILDPGAEYLYVVDEKGNLISDSALLLLLLQHAAREAGSGAAALPLHATRLGEHVVASTGVSIRRTKYSKAALMAEAARPNTVFAATTDGGYIYPSVLPSMDGLFALGKVLELVSTNDQTLSQSGEPPTAGLRSPSDGGLPVGVEGRRHAADDREAARRPGLAGRRHQGLPRALRMGTGAARRRGAAVPRLRRGRE